MILKLFFVWKKYFLLVQLNILMIFLIIYNILKLKSQRFLTKYKFVRIIEIMKKKKIEKMKFLISIYSGLKMCLIFIVLCLIDKCNLKFY